MVMEINSEIKRIILHCFITAFVYILIYYLSYRVLSYRIFYIELFVWMAENKYCYIWILSFLFILFRKYILSYCVTFGNILGIFIGQYLGDYIRNIRMEKITPFSTVEQKWYLSMHYGVAIWIIVILIFLIIGLVVSRIINKK